MKNNETKSKKLNITFKSLLVALGIAVAAHSCSTIVGPNLQEDITIENENPEDNNDLNNEETESTIENNDIKEPSFETESKEPTSSKEHDDASQSNDSKEETKNEDSNNNTEKDNKDEEKHNHKFKSWKYYDEEKEVSICEDCGKENYRKHKFKDKSQFSFKSNEDGTHTIIETKQCEDCEYKAIIETIVNCQLSSWTYNSTSGQEERTCKECDYKLTQEHRHITPTNINYKFYGSNGNGTHKLKASYNCTSCGAEMESYQDENCNMGSWSYNSSTGLEERGCNVCEHEETRAHTHSNAPSNLTFRLDITYGNGKHKLRAVYNCNICNQMLSITKDENCNMGSWSYNSSTGLEERGCNVCEYEETRAHTHSNAPSNLAFRLDRTYGNGTHKLKAVYNCNICNQMLSITKDENCNIGEWSYNSSTGLEERGCNVCEYEETRNHEHQIPTNLIYKLDKTYLNGTHKLKASYTCSTCNEQITLYKDEDCKYEGWTIKDQTSCIRECQICGYDNIKNHNFILVPNSVTSNETIGLHNVLQKCNDCSHEKTVPVTCTSDGNKNYTNINGIPQEYENCSECGDMCILSPHNHTFGNYTAKDDNYHQSSCVCGEEISEAHNWGEWVLVESEGIKTSTCTECGRTKSTHGCVYTENIVKVGTADTCCSIVTTCIYGCGYESITHDGGHQFSLEGQSPIFGDTYICEKCDYSYVAPHATASANNDESQTVNKQLILR